MRTLPLQASAALLVCIGASTASAQTTIYGVDNRLGNFFQSNTATFVASYTTIGAQPTFFPCVDFDGSATTVWVSQYYTPGYGTLDLGTGAYTNVGTITGASGNPTGWSADPDGSTWWYGVYDSATATSNLYTFDPGTGVATLIGVISTGIQIDIAIDSRGNLYGHNIIDDSLYSIDTTTGVGTLIGPTGYPANYAQGMDFDWADDTLYATIYTGGGTGSFVKFDLATGAGLLLENTTPLNAEMEMACEATGSGEPGTPYCFCDQNNPSGNVPPCGNWNDGSDPNGAGCEHQEGPWGVGGARLHAIGLASVSNDTLALRLLRGPAANWTLFLQADNNLDGTGVFLGDGISCAGGGLIRLKISLSNNAGNVSSTPTVISVKSAANGHAIVPGETLYYQAWFRDPNGSTCGNESNSSNGYEITWGA